MRVALHSAIEGFFKSKPPYSNSELLGHVRKAASLGFGCYQVGPLWSFPEIDARELRIALDRGGLKANVHVGGRYDAEKFAATEREYEKVQEEINRGIKLCQAVSSNLVSIHPPFFAAEEPKDSKLLSKARIRFFKLVSEEVESASAIGVKMALESFCYPPFVFSNIHDFMQFILHFSPSELGVLLDAGHLFNAGISLDWAISMFKDRLFDVHVHDAKVQEDFAEATHLPIGMGNIDFVRLLSQLRRVGYESWLTLEINGNEKQIIESRMVLEKLLEKIP